MRITVKNEGLILREKLDHGNRKSKRTRRPHDGTKRFKMRNDQDNPQSQLVPNLSKRL